MCFINLSVITFHLDNHTSDLPVMTNIKAWLKIRLQNGFFLPKNLRYLYHRIKSTIYYQNIELNFISNYIIY